MNLLNDGGPLFMCTILAVLIICVALIIKEFLKPDEKGKVLELLKSLSLFALIFGFLGQMIGLIGAFDAISLATSVSHGVLAAGLKIGLLAPTFGAFTFLIARLGIIALILQKK